ncbi:MAG: Spy/CpxP family protein refolding chaperone [Hyphomicrobiaceae bacterium]
MKIGIVILITVALASPAMAQQHHHGKQHPATPYAGLQQRDIKALDDQQIADLKNGRGIGLALAAELNGYPGPSHVLELKDRLQLTADQRHQFRRLFDSMKAEAIDVGEKLIADERALDRRFAERGMTPEALAALSSKIGETQGQLRAVHLKYHLTSAQLLSTEQRQRYAQLRGYR